MEYPENYFKSDGNITAIDGNGKVISVGHIDYAIGIITIFPNVNSASSYTTSDGQAYWPMNTLLPTVHDMDLLKASVGQGSGEDSITLVGYIRRSNQGQALKISLNLEAMDDITNYTDNTYLAFSQPAVFKVLKGERAVTTVISAHDYQPPSIYRDAINRKTVFDRKA